MKRIIRLLSLVFALIILLSSTVFASSPDSDNVNAEADARVQQIDALLAARQDIVFSDVPDLVALNDIDLQLHDLGVNFYTDAEAAERFPEASAAMTQSTSGTVDVGAGNVAQPAYDIEGNGKGINLWTEYRVSDYYCEDEWLNIQRIIVSPLNDNDYGLVDIDDSSHEFTDEPWWVLTEMILTVGATAALAQLHPVAAVLYDIFAATHAFITADTEVQVKEAYYSWKCETTVVFSYVRYESEPDEEQMLAVVASKCDVEVDCVLNVTNYTNIDVEYIGEMTDKWSGKYNVTYQSPHYNSNARAAFVFQHDSNTAYDSVTVINISPPQAVTPYVIYPPTPQFPLQLD